MQRRGLSTSWDVYMVAAAGLMLVAQTRTHSFVPLVGRFRPAMLLGVLALVVLVLEKDRRRSPVLAFRTSVGKAAIFVAVWAVMTTPVAISFGSAASFILAEFSRTFLLFVILACAPRDLEDVRRLLATFAVGVTIFAARAPIGSNRSGGIGGYDVNDAAMLLVSGIPILVFFALYGRHRFTKFGSGAAILMALAVVVRTQSRGGFLALVAVIGVMLFTIKELKRSVRLGIVAVIIVAMVPLASGDFWDRMSTITELDDGYGGGAGLGGRRNVWARAVGYTLDNPVTGLGVNQFSRAEGLHPLIQARLNAGFGAKFNVAHSSWFQAMAELGIPGFIAFVMIFVLSLKELRRLQRGGWRSPPPMRPDEGRVMAALLLASLVGAMTAGSFLTHAYSSMVWGVLGIIVGFVKLAGSGGRAGPALASSRAAVGPGRGRSNRPRPRVPGHPV